MTTRSNESGVKLTCSITRNYGAVSATFGAEVIIKGDSSEPPRQGYAVLMDIIHEQFDHYESAVLHKSVPEQPTYDQKGNGTRPEIVDCKELICALEKGEIVYKITGGKFSKYGVRIWPEVLEQYRDLRGFQAGKSYNMTGWKMAVDTSKAAKVVQLVAPHAQ